MNFPRNIVIYYNAKLIYFCDLLNIFEITENTMI